MHFLVSGLLPPTPHLPDDNSSFLLRSRNFDPVTRQPTKRPRPASSSTATAGEEQQEGLRDGETVERRVQGLAQEIVKRDEEKRKEELVSFWAPGRRKRRVALTDTLLPPPPCLSLALPFFACS